MRSSLSLAALVGVAATGVLGAPLLGLNVDVQETPLRPDGRYGGADLNLTRVLQQAVRLSEHSWEYGAATQALLEVLSPELSVFSRDAFPDDRLPAPDAATPALAYARRHIRTDNTTLVEGDGSAADPMSLGVAAVLLGQTQPSYRRAAQRQMQYMLTQVPRGPNGAMSMRDNYFETWADYMFMAPPTLAYYAVATRNASLLRDVVRDIGAQRAILRGNQTGDVAGLWTHIVGPRSQTLGLWTSGNGWAALGMVRVLATIKHWQYSNLNLNAEAAELRTWLYDLFGGLRGAAKDPDNGLYRVYLAGGARGIDDGDNDEWKGDVAGSAALAAAAFRLAVLDRANATDVLPWALEMRDAVNKAVDPATGIGAPAVNPLDWFSKVPFTSGSPEGQAFIAMMGAAHADCVASQVCDA
jgi:hypothetical protein